jgi:hydroxymethylpyrimidine/phosphomethylpyrimidine kinase
VIAEKMNHTPSAQVPVVLSIAGFDPSAGAGSAADLKTIAANNCYGVAAITALTVQNTSGVRSVEPVSARVLRESIAALLEDGQVRAVKIGLLPNRAVAEVVAEALDANASLPSVLDTVLRSASGYDFVDAAGLDYLRRELLRRATVITPNLEEAAALTGEKVTNVEEMKKAAQRLREMGARAVVVTGGHLEKAPDVYCDGNQLEVFVGDRVKLDQTHGTGCTFSSAIAANLALGRQLRDAVMLAKAFVAESIKKAYPIGPGRVPLNHLYRLQQQPRTVDHVAGTAEGSH